MDSSADRRGVLYPAKLPEFIRVQAPEPLRDRVGWFWMARWNISPGRTSRQELLPFPCMNLDIQRQGVTLSGAARGASHRDLTGTGWVLAAMLLPASTPAFGFDPRALLGTEVSIPGSELHAPVCELMTGAANSESLEAAIKLLAAWLEEKVPHAKSQGLLANQLLELAAGQRDIVNVPQLANMLGISVRSVQRLARDYVGLTPLSIIRRYRLQEAAQRLRENPEITITQIASELEYADHAHFTTDFRQVLGFTPSAYRANSQPLHEALRASRHVAQPPH
ncbi:helix-turn-helix domain-containing protein [Glutamicibacter arilaitensis]|uniref:helix-turn-helix transcriptional regulator n=1 Tax=Glutamicibacter arilaitensis TaxID=256701 RepID=UPI00384D0AB9